MTNYRIDRSLKSDIDAIDREHIREQTRINIINTVGLLSIDWIEAKEIITSVIQSINAEVESTGSIYEVWKNEDR